MAKQKAAFREMNMKESRVTYPDYDFLKKKPFSESGRQRIL
jgi:hypothetical protein